ncbi:unnamed protein product [Paramecium octaurelia]|uniref:Uncharacterized protein n=1 Tax=Paramecium octaurelia TaxID=43137 RepID=A0A8S1UYE1_PAROT|nr:unnamed protein product [Paramecium octaurelia]
MGCVQNKAKLSMSQRIIHLQEKSASIAIHHQQFQIKDQQYNILKNPIMRRREQKKSKISYTSACTPIMND